MSKTIRALREDTTRASWLFRILNLANGYLAFSEWCTNEVLQVLCYGDQSELGGMFAGAGATPVTGMSVVIQSGMLDAERILSRVHQA